MSARQAALIGAMAVILSSVIAILASYVSASLASSSTLRAASLQVSGESEKSRAEFLRGQRQVLYAQVIGHERALSSALARFYDADPDGRASAWKPLRNSTDKAKSRFDGDESSIVVLGSESAVKQFKLLKESYDAYYCSVASEFEGPVVAPTSEPTAPLDPSPTPSSTPIDPCPDDPDDASAAMEKYRDAVLAAFRADMGAR